MEKIIPK